MDRQVRELASGAVLVDRLRPALTHWTRLRGLLGTSSLPPGDGLWLKPCSQVHMFGMRYAIDVVFLDDALRVVRTVADLRPWRVSPKVVAATSVLELPAGTLASVGLADGACLAIDGYVAPTRRVAADVGAPAATGRRRSPSGRALAWIAGFLALTGLLVPLGRRVVTSPQILPGFACYWSAATLLAHGQSPYDLEQLRTIQLKYGWDKQVDGFGLWEYLPNYYPPSVLSLATLALVPLGFATARATWLIVNAEFLLIAGYLLRSLLPRVSPRVPMILVPAFCLSVMSVLLGQVTPLILLSVVAIWKLLEERWDASAGFLLAWAMIKPSLTVPLAVALLLWSLRERRWRVITGCVAGAVVLLLVSTWLVPGWPLQLAHAAAAMPFITVVYPWIGTTWLLVLRAVGLDGVPLWLAYALVALPFGAAVVRYALDPERPLADVVAISLLAVFFVSPTARPYDEPLLLVPLLVVIDKRGSDALAGLLLFLLLLPPYVQFVTTSVPEHVWFFWVPVVTAVAWFGSGAATSRDAVRVRPFVREATALVAPS